MVDFSIERVFKYKILLLYYLPHSGAKLEIGQSWPIMANYDHLLIQMNLILIGLK